MIRFLFSFPWGTFTTSSGIALITGIVVFALGAPPALLILVSWAGATVYRSLGSRFAQQLDVVPNQVVPKQLVETSNWRAMAEGAVLSVVVVAIEPAGELAASL